MAQTEQVYICIDLKSYYASVECVSRGLDPMTAKLVVADPERGGGTICLAVSPALKAQGVPGRCRVYEIPKCLDYIKAPPRMHKYMEVSAEIFGIYLDYISPDDIHIYSIDECFINVGPYLSYYKKTPVEMARMLMNAVLEQTGIPSTCGIGPNLFLCKVALDIEAKKSPDGIAYIDEGAFFERIWHHKPITDIWQISHGTERRLAKYGISDLSGVANASLEVLKKEFGINAQLLYDHAWGKESCTIAEIKKYKPRSNSVSCGQVLMRDYTKDEARVVLREMAHEILLDLTARKCICSNFAVAIGYSFSNVEDGLREGVAAYGSVASAAQNLAYRLQTARNSGSKKLAFATAAPGIIFSEILDMYDSIADDELKIRRLNISLGELLPVEAEEVPLFYDAEAVHEENDLFSAIAKARSKFGRDAIMWGNSLLDCATGYERARQIGGHRA